MPSKKKTSPKIAPTNDRIIHPHWEDMGRKILLTLMGILVAYSIIFVGTLIRNNLRSYYTIGYADKVERTITLDAQGKATIKPDVAMTTIGMQTEGETVAAAQEDNTTVMNQLIARLKDLGIQEEDIQTSNYNIYPRYNYTEEDGRVLEGYQVSQSVSVKIRELDKANTVLAIAGEVGANNVSGLTFTIDDTEVYKKEARKDALSKIDTKARELEQALGVDIIKVVNYSESTPGNNNYRPMYAASDAFGVAEGSAPEIEAGTENILVNVAITFEIR